MATTAGPCLRVMTYNVHGLRDDLGALAAVVRAAAPDVLMLQEAAGRFRWRARCARTARSFGMLVGAGGMPAVGNVIMTSARIRVHEAWALRYPLTPGRHLRGAAFARCSLGRVPFVAVGSHLSTDPNERPGQADLLRRAMADLTEPVIFAGDINETPGGAAWRMLADGMRETGQDDGAATFPARDARSRIDVILVGAGCRVIRHSVLDSPAARVASDHLPVVADVFLPAPD